MIADLDIDGNGIANVGIDINCSNILERVCVTQCVQAGVRMPLFANSSRLVNCGFIYNDGWGLLVDGGGNTIFSAVGCLFNLNTLGGANIQAGNHLKFLSCVFESNDGPGLRIYRPTSNSNAFSVFDFDTCWVEGNASTSPNFAVVLGSDTSDPTYGPQRVRFRNCRISVPSTTRKYLSAEICRFVEFENCSFSGSEASDAITLSSNARYVSFIECAEGVGHGGGDGLTATQLDNALAQGAYCWAHDPSVKRVVGAGSPAASFTNYWVNNGAGYADAAYYFTEDGEVVIEGSVKNGTALTSVFTLPAGYRPPTTRRFAVDSNGAYGMVTVNTNGTVVQSVGVNTVLHLNGIRFRTAP